MARQRALLLELFRSLPLPKELYGIVAGYCIVETIVTDTHGVERLVVCGGFVAINASPDVRAPSPTEDWCSVFAAETLRMRSSFAAVVRWPHQCVRTRRCYIGVARREADDGDDIPSHRMWAVNAARYEHYRKFHATWSDGETYTPIKRIPFVDLPGCICPTTRPNAGTDHAPLPGNGVAVETEWRVEIRADLATGSLRFIIDGADQGVLWTGIPSLGELFPFASISAWGNPAVAFTPTPGFAE